MNDQMQGPQVQVDVGDQLFHCIVESLARLEAQHERMSERIDGLSGNLQELVKRQSALGSHQTIISIPSVVQDAIAPCSEGQIGVVNERDETQSISAIHADNLKRKHVRQDSHFGFDGEDQRAMHRLIAISKAQDALPRSTYIEDDIDTRAYKLVDQVMFDKKLLNPTTNVDARSWLVTMAKDLFDKDTPLRRIRLCLHFFAAILEPETLISLKTADKQQQAEEKAKTDAMLFCIQLHVGYSGLENPSSQPKLAYGVPSEYVIFTEKYLNNLKAKRAAWKNKELRQAIEMGSKLEVLRLHMGPGTIHMIPAKIWLEIFPEMTIDNIECVCGKNKRLYIPNFRGISGGLLGSQSTTVNMTGGVAPCDANGQIMPAPGLFLEAVTDDVINSGVYSLQELFHHANDVV